jgi:hypothetical protein
MGHIHTHPRRTHPSSQQRRKPPQRFPIVVTHQDHAVPKTIQKERRFTVNKYDEGFAMSRLINKNTVEAMPSAIDSTNPTLFGMSVSPSILNKEPNAETLSLLPAHKIITVVNSLCQSASHQHAVAIVGSPCRRRNHVQCGTCACRRDQLFGVRSTLIDPALFVLQTRPRWRPACTV